MDTVKIIFSTRTNPVSWFIRLVTWSDWSHAGIIDGDDVIESTMTNGVIRRSLESFKGVASKWCIAEMKVADAEKFMAFSKEQIGKDYDFSAIFGILLHRDWQEDDSWFCFELIAAAAVESGYFAYHPEAISRITGNDLFDLTDITPLETN